MGYSFAKPTEAFRRRFFNSMCKGKVKYRQPAAADLRIEERKKAIGKDLYRYTCPLCGWWHLTHKK